MPDVYYTFSNTTINISLSQRKSKIFTTRHDLLVGQCVYVIIDNLAKELMEFHIDPIENMIGYDHTITTQYSIQKTNVVA
jgi:hypothetical protein